MLVSIILLLLALIGLPLFVVIAAGAFWGFSQEEVDLTVVAIEFFRLADLPVLVAIPLFTFAGYLLSESKAPQRMVTLSHALLGWLPGGLAIVSLVACAVFTAFTGASGITIIALGAIIYPALKADGYGDRFSLGLVTTSGSLGLLFAPSLPLILYGVVVQQLSMGTQVSIDDLFIAGLIPGMLMLALLTAYSVYKRPRTENLAAAGEIPLGSALREAAWELPLPILVLGSIYGGILAVSEVAALTAAYVFIVEVFIHREVGLAKLLKISRESMMMVGGILVILGVSLASTNYVIDTGLPEKIFAVMEQYVDSRNGFIAVLLVFLLLLGMFLDVFSALVLVVPIILPIALEFGLDPVHLGIVFLATMQIGYFTPPVGMNLFIASYRFSKPIMTLYRSTIPFFVILLAAVVVIAYLPVLSLGLLR